MMHRRRIWCLHEVASPDELARKLVEQTWTLCTAFYVRGHEEYLFLNDATHEDAAAEFAVVHRQPDGSFVQVESITFSWCTTEKALEYVREALAGGFDAHDLVRPVTPAIEEPSLHGRCPLCA